MKVLAGVVALSLGASACFRSRQRQAADDAPDAASDAATDAATDAAAPHDAAAPELPADASGIDVVLAFEQLLIRYCACETAGACADAWNDQFEDASKVCVADAIDRAGVSACAASGVRELVECWYGAGCRRCPAGELTEDTPLADLVAESCAGEPAHAYVEALRATANCRR